MNIRIAKTVRVLACAILTACFAFSVYLAIGAYHGSKEVGAGAAQGGLGFFMLLSVVSPVVLLLAALLWWVERLIAQRSLPTITQSSLVRWLSIGNVIAIGFNWWVFVQFFWRA